MGESGLGEAGSRSRRQGSGAGKPRRGQAPWRSKEAAARYPAIWRRESSAQDSINGNGDKSRKARPSGKPPKSFLAVATAVPQAVLADDHEPWRDEIDFEITEPVEGRRIFVEGLTVSGDRAAVTLRAATALDVRVRAFGGPQGTWLRFWGSAFLAEGERIDYSLPLHGPAPSFTVSWEDSLGEAGALTFEEAQLPFPLPVVEGELCDLRMTSLGWTPGAVSGVLESECVTHIEHPVEDLSLASAVGSDDPFAILVLPEPEPEEPPAEQEPADGPVSSTGQALRDWFEALGWEWSW